MKQQGDGVQGMEEWGIGDPRYAGDGAIGYGGPPGMGQCGDGGPQRRRGHSIRVMGCRGWRNGVKGNPGMQRMEQWGNGDARMEQWDMRDP